MRRSALAFFAHGMRASYPTSRINAGHFKTASTQRFRPGHRSHIAKNYSVEDFSGRRPTKRRCRSCSASRKSRMYPSSRGHTPRRPQGIYLVMRVFDDMMAPARSLCCWGGGGEPARRGTSGIADCRRFPGRARAPDVQRRALLPDLRRGGHVPDALQNGACAFRR